MRPLSLCWMIFAVSPLAAQETLSADKLSLIKRAAVLVLVDDGSSGGSGSGFLVRVDGTTGYIATNNHVIDLSDGRRPRNAPRAEAVEVVFDSGQIGERVVKAEVIAADPDRDLAILKVENVKALPAPIPLDAPPKLTETMPVLVCGFPFGESLATSRKHPAITISNSTVSSIRLDDFGQVVRIQLAGSALNPGNSGGPILTPDGKLAGVAVAAIRGSGIGFGVPHLELTKLLKGRIGRPAVFATPLDDKTVQFSVEAPLLDPFGAIRGVSVHHKTTASGDRPPHPDNQGQWASLSATGLEAEVRDGVASTKLRVPRGNAASLWVQFEFRTADGLVREEPVELAWPQFARGATTGIALTPVQFEHREGPTTGPKNQVSLKDLNRWPDQFLGQSVTFDAMLLKDTEAVGEKTALGIGFDRQSRPLNVKVLSTPALARQFQDAVKDHPRNVRIRGTVLAPFAANTAYIIESDEISLLDGNGVVTASYKPGSLPDKVPMPSPDTTAPPSEPNPTADPASDDSPLGTIAGVSLTLVAMGIIAILAFKKRTAKSKPPAPILPTETVAERLHRRVK